MLSSRAFLLSALLTVGAAAEAQIPTRTANCQCADGSANPSCDRNVCCMRMMGRACDDIGSVTDAVSSVTGSTTGISTPSPQAMMVQAGGQLILGIASAIAERRQRKLEEQRRVEQAIQEEQQRQQQQFEKERAETLAKMKGTKPGEATLKTMNEFGRERDQALQTAIARVRSNLGNFFETYDRDFDRPDSSDCLDNCGTIGDTLGGQQVDHDCVRACLTGEGSGSAVENTATVLANLGQLEAPESPLALITGDGVTLRGSLTPKLLRTESLEPMQQNSTWGTSRFGARITPDAFGKLEQIAFDSAFARLYGTGVEKLAGAIPGGDKLIEFHDKFAVQTLINFRTVLSILPEAAAAAGQLSDAPVARLEQTTERIAAGYDETARDTLVSAVGNPIEKIKEKMTSETFASFMPKFVTGWGKGTDLVEDDPLKTAAIEERPVHVDWRRIPMTWGGLRQ